MTPSDPELVGVSGPLSADSLEALYDRHGGLAYSLAVSILHDTEAASDVVEEAFLSVWRRAATYGREHGSVRAWICSIVHDRAIHHVRGRATPGTSGAGHDRVPRRGSGTGSRDRPARNRSSTATGGRLAALPPEQRDILELAYFAGCSQSETGDLLGLPATTVASQTRGALRTLLASTEEPATTTTPTTAPLPPRRALR